MKSTLCILAAFAFFNVAAQSSFKTRHIFIITTDGFRWQEVFKGADPLLVGNKRYTRDTELMKQLYWDSTAELRRARLMPFFWNVIARRGQIYGNRSLENKVNVANFYKISYPGYNEIFTGHNSGLISPNLPINNKNRNVLEYLNATKEYKGKVVAFSSWNVFPFILNEERSQLYMNSGYTPPFNSEKDSFNGEGDIAGRMISRMQDSISPKTSTRYDLLTWLSAREYIGRNHPSVVFIGLGETDEFAHAGRYDLYLQQAANIDKMIADLWYFVQTDPYYKDNTSFLITTDHGRGSTPGSWATHGFWIKGSGETWLAMLGPDILPEGEMKKPGQVYQKQLAATVSMLMGEQFQADHRVGKAMDLPAAANTGLAAGR